MLHYERRTAVVFKDEDGNIDKTLIEFVKNEQEDFLLDNMTKKSTRQKIRFYDKPYTRVSDRGDHIEVESTIEYKYLLPY